MVFMGGAAVVGAAVGVGVTTGAGGWDVQPATRIPINRIARITKSFLMRFHRGSISYMYIYNYLYFSKTVIVTPVYLEEPYNFCWNNHGKKSTLTSGIQVVPRIGDLPLMYSP
jgi:hypothetical protein